MDATQVPGQQQRPRISSRSTKGKPPERFDPGPAPDPICAQASSKRSDKSVTVAPASHSPASSKSSLKSTKKTPHGISPHLAVSTTTLSSPALNSTLTKKAPRKSSLSSNTSHLTNPVPLSSKGTIGGNNSGKASAQSISLPPVDISTVIALTSTQVVHEVSQVVVQQVQ